MILSGTMALPEVLRLSSCQIDHGACPKLTFDPYYRLQQAKQVTPPEKRRSSVIGLSFPPIQHLYVGIVFNDSQKV